MRSHAAQILLIIAAVLALRLPFLNQPIQGDDVYYFYGAEHAQIDPLHPNHTRYVFLGDEVDMRGSSHGPMNSWILGAILAAVGDVREVPFHLAYSLFSIVAALATWWLAGRFSERPLLATLLFIAVPPFVVNGNSLEADIPFLAFWLLSMALFVAAVDRESKLALAGSAIAAALASMAAYQAIFLTPILFLYLWQTHRRWLPGWAAAMAAPAAILIWQVFERASSGALPAAVLSNYMQVYGFQVLAQKVRSAAALLVHTGWIVSPIIVWGAFAKGRWRISAAAAVGVVAAIYDFNPLFWISIATGVLVLSWTISEGKLMGQWIAIFFAGALVIFFAGSARYLLPIAAPVAILAVRFAKPWLLATGFALQVALSLTLAAANFQHWEGYRQFAESLAPKVVGKHVWVNAEWGLRFYLESRGALPLTKNQPLAPGDIVVSSTLAHPVIVRAPLAPLAQTEIVPALPFLLISLSGRSGYSSSASGLLPFEIANEPADRIRAEVVLERKAELTYLNPKASESAGQILSGLYPDGWMEREASVLLKTPSGRAGLRVDFFIPPDAPARQMRMIVEGEVIADVTYQKAGPYSLAAPYSTTDPSITLTIATDKTHRTAGDQRDLGVVITGVGFK